MNLLFKRPSVALCEKHSKFNSKIPLLFSFFSFPQSQYFVRQQIIVNNLQQSHKSQHGVEKTKLGGVIGDYKFD
jgi:hypothetical protein